MELNEIENNKIINKFINIFEEYQTILNENINLDSKDQNYNHYQNRILEIDNFFSMKKFMIEKELKFQQQLE